VGWGSAHLPSWSGRRAISRRRCDAFRRVALPDCVSPVRATAPSYLCLLAGVLTLLVGALAPLSATAQSVNPGQIDNEIRRQQEQIERQTQPRKFDGNTIVAPSRESQNQLRPGGPKFKLKNVTFGQSKFLTVSELDAIKRKYVGRSVDFSQLQQLLADVNKLYEAKGIVTGVATLPPQSIDTGVVHIKLTEGRLGRSSVTGLNQTSPGYVAQRVAVPARGEVIDVPKISRDISWFNRTNDAQIRALLQPGSSFGLTDLQLSVTEPAVNTLQITGDNQGIQNTGKYQGSVFYRRHGMLGVDDRLTFYGVKAQGNLNSNVAYNIPVNTWGGRAAVSYTQGTIRIVDGVLVPLDVTGKSQVGSASLTQPFYADQNWLAQASVAGSLGRSQTYFTGVGVTDDQSRKMTYGLALSSFSTYHSLTLSPNVNAVSAHNINDLERTFNVYNATLNGYFRFLDLVPILQENSVTVLASSQYTSEKLLPGDQLFQIGGPTTIRGYPSNAVSGDSGYYANLEWHRSFATLVAGLDIFGFYDFGEAYSTFPAVRNLSSLGAGLSWTPLNYLTFEATFAAPQIEVVASQPKYEGYFRVSLRPLLIWPGT